jgi:hypothetical protein
MLRLAARSGIPYDSMLHRVDQQARKVGPTWRMRLRDFEDKDLCPTRECLVVGRARESPLI